MASPSSFAAGSVGQPSSSYSPQNISASSASNPRIKRPLPELPFTLQSHILSFLLPPTPPLPLESLSQVFRHRLTYLPPTESEMDRQLSPFPLPITSALLTERLERLARGYELGPVKYGWDGEAGLAYRTISAEGSKGRYRLSTNDVDHDLDGDDLEMQYMYNAHDGWGFHGLRLAGDSDNSGVRWVDDAAEIDISPPSDTSVSSDEAESTSVPNGSLDPHAYTSASYSGVGAGADGRQSGHDEAADYWAGFSPPPSPPAELLSGSELDEDERERQYWAQYSAGPSKAASPVLSRRQSSAGGNNDDLGRGGLRMTEPQPGDGELDDESPRDGASQQVSHKRRERADTMKPDPIYGVITDTAPDTAGPSGEEATAELDAPTAPPPHLPISYSPASASSAALLRSRLQMKTLSLLRRAWLEYSDGVERADELEERGIRWLALARDVQRPNANAKTQGLNDTGHYQNGSLEVGARVRLETLLEMYEVFGDQHDAAAAAADEGQGGTEGFHRLVEQAMAGEVGAGGGDGEGEGGGALGLRRNYSFDQQGYWE